MDKAESLRDEYRIRFAKTAQYRNNVWKILCDEYFSAFVSPEAHVLDLGSGWGEFINNVDAARKYAMDLNPTRVDGCLETPISSIRIARKNGRFGRNRSMLFSPAIFLSTFPTRRMSNGRSRRPIAA